MTQTNQQASVPDASSAPLGFEDTLWQAADTLRGNLDASEYKNVVLGLIFLKYVSDAFAERRAFLETATADPDSEYHTPSEDQRELVLEDRDEYLAANVFWVPPEARWDHIQSKAKQPEIGQVIDKAMDLIEKDNPRLRAVLPKNYGRAELDKRRLGQLVDQIATIAFDKSARDKDVFGRVYEYCLMKFDAQYKRAAGEYYTPRSVVALLVEMLEPFRGRVYDPCSGSGGMFVQSARFVEEHGGVVNDLSVYGQESNPNTWRLARMNLAIRGIEADLGDQWSDTFHADKHPDLKADFVLANPPFNDDEWGGEQLKDDQRWKYGTPPAGNANFAWVQHIIHHLAPGGTAGIVLANGSMSTQQSGEGEIRKRLVEANLVDCMVALPGQLFYTTQIPVCLWFLARERQNGKYRDRRGEILFIDARKLGEMVSRTHKILTDDDIAKIASTYHAWRGEEKDGEYQDVAGFCKATTIKEITEHDFILTPGRYVGAEDIEDDSEPFDEKMVRLTTTLAEQFAESAELEKRIRGNLTEVGYGL